LLAFTRLSHEPMTLEKVDIEKLVQTIINDRVDFQPPRALVENKAALTNMVGDTASLSQCLTNLLDNAVKFVAPGIIPRISLYSERKDDMIRLWIKDNGIGFQTVEQDQLFRMFERGHGNEYPGTGIGLAIVRKAVERMGGTAGVESEPGKGSRFWLELRGETS
jgi:signal transduction histidine kinase